MDILRHSSRYMMGGGGESVKCPKCGRENRPNAEGCECGHSLLNNARSGPIVSCPKCKALAPTSEAPSVKCVPQAHERGSSPWLPLVIILVLAFFIFAVLTSKHDPPITRQMTPEEQRQAALEERQKDLQSHLRGNWVSDVKSVTILTEGEARTETVLVELQTGDIGANSPTAYDMIRDVEQVSKRVTNYKYAQGGAVITGMLKIVISGPVLDQYGNSLIERLMSLDFSLADLRKVNWDNILDAQLLNLANRIEISPVARDIWRDWCAKARNSYCRLCSQL